MSRTVTAIRNVGDVLLTKTLELPIEPVVGHTVVIEGAAGPKGEELLRIGRVIVTPMAHPWQPGLKKPSVAIFFEYEPDPVCDVRDKARELGWEGPPDGR